MSRLFLANVCFITACVCVCVCVRLKEEEESTTGYFQLCPYSYLMLLVGTKRSVCICTRMRPSAGGASKSGGGLRRVFKNAAPQDPLLPPFPVNLSSGKYHI